MGALPVALGEWEIEIPWDTETDQLPGNRQEPGLRQPGREAGLMGGWSLLRVFPWRDPTIQALHEKGEGLILGLQGVWGAQGQRDLGLASRRVWNPEALPMEGVPPLLKTRSPCCPGHRAR